MIYERVENYSLTKRVSPRHLYSTLIYVEYLCVPQLGYNHNVARYLYFDPAISLIFIYITWAPHGQFTYTATT